MNTQDSNFIKRHKYARVILPNKKMVTRQLYDDKFNGNWYFVHKNQKRYLYKTGSGSWVASGGYRVFSFTNSAI